MRNIINFFEHWVVVLSKQHAKGEEPHVLPKSWRGYTAYATRPLFPWWA